MVCDFVCVDINAPSSRISLLRRENWITGLDWDEMDKNGHGLMGLSCSKGHSATCHFLLIDYSLVACFSLRSSVKVTVAGLFLVFADIGQKKKKNHQGMIVGSWPAVAHQRGTGCEHPAMPTPTSSVTCSSDSASPRWQNNEQTIVCQKASAASITFYKLSFHFSPKSVALRKGIHWRFINKREHTEQCSQIYLRCAA